VSIFVILLISYLVFGFMKGRSMKKLVTFLICLALIISCMPIASAEEVGNAIYSQTTTIDKNKAEAFKKYVANHNLQEQAEILLGEYGYEKIEDVKLCDYIAIGNTLKKEVKQ
jgi:hypothetical protein